MLGIGRVHWGLLLAEGSHNEQASRMEGTRLETGISSFSPLQAPQGELPCERGHEHEGGRRNTDQVARRWWQGGEPKPGP